MDANARSIRWEPETNEKGKRLEDFIDDYELEILNKKREGPTFSSTSGESYIDVTLATPKLVRYAQNWSIRREWVQSTDHYAIEISLGIPRDGEGLDGAEPKRFNIVLADWEKFHEKQPELARVNLEGLALESVEDVERYVVVLTKTIIESCEFAIPRKKPHKKSYPWWTRERTREKRMVHKARRRHQRELEVEKRTELKKKKKLLDTLQDILKTRRKTERKQLARVCHVERYQGALGQRLQAPGRQTPS
ncbi:uncharacterized protein LOC128667542 [Microplitis demolitor]|uniref:uncharacterized protein LOC128667542 n=1 Tax=Microplitis demolitor TaxID=69319 RepID=UPI00235B6EB4|nr:uncharacterized protein LOC128667542 [Microplitis demolitor]